MMVLSKLFKHFLFLKNLIGIKKIKSIKLIAFRSKIS